MREEMAVMQAEVAGLREEMASLQKGLREAIDTGLRRTGLELTSSLKEILDVQSERIADLENRTSAPAQPTPLPPVLHPRTYFPAPDVQTFVQNESLLQHDQSLSPASFHSNLTI